MLRLVPRQTLELRSFACRKDFSLTLCGAPLSESCPKIWMEGWRLEVGVELKTQGGEREIVKEEREELS